MVRKIVKIGNSYGIRIPRTIIEQLGLGEEVELEVKNNRLIIHAAQTPRKGWPAAFRKMAQKKDDILLDETELHFQNSWDEREWDW